MEAFIQAQQEEGKTLALIATYVLPDWARPICDEFGRGLDWTYELTDDGQKTGEMS